MARGIFNFEHGSGFVDNGKGQDVPMSEGDVVTVAADGTIGTPARKAGPPAIRQSTTRA
jgi:hypothetical protein